MDRQVSDAQEVDLLFKQNFQIPEKGCRWEAHDIVKIPLNFADEHTSETLTQSLVIGQTSPFA